ncbi:PWWP domain-containing protein 5-like [Rutidosis leptorrhynchoides]|uniref:PWWP domain-containing protein 5-like n=1 Tax=Rutidosis leptorrhynchoides TaxID=125765 RepID=UPI003A9A58F0
MMEALSDHGGGAAAARVSIVVNNGVNKVGENIRANIVKNGLDINVSDVKHSHAINLVVDLSRCFAKQSDVEFGEKGGEFRVSDLVWGKVKSHPWWPGVVVDPSGATDKAMKYFKKDGYLIAYFGDQSFSWNESFNIKPFRVNFCKMVDQDDGWGFISAVNDALCEVARRVEYGLACSCLSEKVYMKIKYQTIVNDGIRKGFSRINGGDRFSTVNCFKPVKVVDILQDLATDPFGSNSLEIVTVGGQLSAFNRWKGYYQLQLNEVLDELDDKIDSDNRALDSKEKVNACGRPPKRKLSFDSDESPIKKVRCLSDLMSNGSEIVSDEEYKPKKRGRIRQEVETYGSFKGSQSQSQSQTANEVLSEICQAALDRMGKQHNIDSLNQFSSEFRKHRYTEDKKSQTESQTANEFLSQICRAALEPEEQHNVDSLIQFLSDFREHRYLEDKKSQSQSQTANEFLSQIHWAALEPMEKQHNVDSLIQFLSDFRKHRFIEDENESQPETIEMDGFTGIEDSYWTDRIIVTKSDDEVSPKPNKESFNGTALILKFTNLDSVPSIKKLNEIFRRYGSLQQAETRLLKKKNCVKLVFEKRSDAETAFSSSGKFSIFGPALVSYCLDYKPTPRKTATNSAKKALKSAKAMQFEN